MNPERKNAAAAAEKKEIWALIMEESGLAVQNQQMLATDLHSPGPNLSSVGKSHTIIITIIPIPS